MLLALFPKRVRCCCTSSLTPNAAGIGQYFYGDIHKEAPASCPYPAYLIDAQPVLPYYIP